MKASELLAALKIVQPSLGANDSVYPVMACFCFMGDIIYAYNDVTATIVQFDTGLECGLHGDTLLGILGLAGSEEITITVSDGVGLIKLKSGTVKVPALEPSLFMFTPPDEQPLYVLPFDKLVAEAVEWCLVSTSTESMNQSFNGVTVAVSARELTKFYSTDNASAMRTIAHAGAGGVDVSVVIPTKAAEQMLKLRAGNEKPELQIAQQFATLETKDATFITKLLPSAMKSFEGVFGQHLVGDLFDLPPGFMQEIARADVLLAREGVKECDISSDGKQYTITASGVLGSMKATVRGEQTPGRVRVDPQYVLRFAKQAQALSLRDKASLVFSAGGEGEAAQDYIVSSKAVAEEAPAAPPPKPRQPPPMSPRQPMLDIEDDIPF